MASHKELEKYYSKNRKEAIEFLSDGNYIKCMGCAKMIPVDQIECHHIIKRSNLKYFYADIRNFSFLCHECHTKAEGTVEQQQLLLCYSYLEERKEELLQEYQELPLYKKKDFIKF